MLDFNYFVTLLLINKTDVFKGTYNLSRVLAFKFGIIGFVDLIRSLKEHGLIRILDVGAVEEHEITSSGIHYLNEHANVAKDFLFKEYPSERDFLELLFKRLEEDR